MTFWGFVFYLARVEATEQDFYCTFFYFCPSAPSILPVMNFALLRENYPALSTQTYLNTASCGIISNTTAQVAQRFYQELLEQGGTYRAEWYKQLLLTRQEVAQWLGGQAEEIALLPNFSIASNYVAQALSTQKRVLLLDSDYPSLTMPWLLHNYDVHYFSAKDNGFFDLNVIEEKIKTNNINVLAISHVQYATGFCVNLETLGRYCRHWGVLLMVDATQSLGVIPIDLRKMPVDILVGSGYKWMTAGFGNALLYIRREWHERLSVAAVGSNSFDDSPRITSREEIDFSARILEVGHYDFSSFFAMRQAVQELQAIGPEAISQRVKVLTRYLHRHLPDKTTVVSDYPEAYHSGITVIEGSPALEKKLLSHGVVTSARVRGLRISLHFYNNETDIDHLCEVLAEGL